MGSARSGRSALAGGLAAPTRAGRRPPSARSPLCASSILPAGDASPRAGERRRKDGETAALLRAARSPSRVPDPRWSRREAAFVAHESRYAREGVARAGYEICGAGGYGAAPVRDSRGVVSAEAAGQSVGDARTKRGVPLTRPAPSRAAADAATAAFRAPRAAPSGPYAPRRPQTELPWSRPFGSMRRLARAGACGRAGARSPNAAERPSGVERAVPPPFPSPCVGPHQGSRLGRDRESAPPRPAAPPAQTPNSAFISQSRRRGLAGRTRAAPRERGGRLPASASQTPFGRAPTRERRLHPRQRVLCRLHVGTCRDVVLRRRSLPPPLRVLVLFARSLVDRPPLSPAVPAATTARGRPCHPVGLNGAAVLFPTFLLRFHALIA